MSKSKMFGHLWTKLSIAHFNLSNNPFFYFLQIKANNAGINVIVSALTAHQTAREHIKETIPNLLVGHVDCPIDICVARDPKGLYEKARNGEIDTLIGYNSTYQPPVEPDIKLDTSRFSAEENAHRLYRFLGNHIK